MNPLAVVGHVAAARRAALRGDQNGIQTNVGAIQKDMLRSIRMPDPARRINHEAARAAVRPIAGVRSAVWMDHENLLVMVGGARYRTMQTIDNVCSALNPLGDTLAVVVNVQNVQARTSEEADTLSRNCQLARGERAFMQRKRKVDVHDSQLRQAFKAQQGRR